MDKFNQKYKKIKAIGQGAFGKVYLVENKELFKLAVVKVIDSSKMNEKEVSDVMNEIGIMEKLFHPYVVQIYDHLVLKKSICIVMQFADGSFMLSDFRRQPGGQDQVKKWKVF